MVQTIRNRSQVPLDSCDLETCQRVFDKISSDHAVAKDSDEAQRMASIIIDLYRQGVRDPNHLSAMVEAARGLFEPDSGDDPKALLPEGGSAATRKRGGHRSRRSTSRGTACMTYVSAGAARASSAE